MVPKNRDKRIDAGPRQQEWQNKGPQRLWEHRNRRRGQSRRSARMPRLFTTAETDSRPHAVPSWRAPSTQARCALLRHSACRRDHVFALGRPSVFCARLIRPVSEKASVCPSKPLRRVNVNGRVDRADLSMTGGRVSPIRTAFGSVVVLCPPSPRPTLAASCPPRGRWSPLVREA